MIRRLHARAGQVLVLGTVLILTLTAAAQAAKVSYVTTEEMHRFVVVTFLSGAGVVLGGLAVVFSMVSGARDKEMRAAIAANTKAVADLAEMFRAHHLDADAHPAGSRARIDPINEKLDELREKQEEIHLNLTALVAEHHQIRKSEDALCRVLANRDPKASPHPKRGDDPPDFDGRGLRGKK